MVIKPASSLVKSLRKRLNRILSSVSVGQVGIVGTSNIVITLLLRFLVTKE